MGSGSTSDDEWYRSIESIFDDLALFAVSESYGTKMGIRSTH
jgi:hypothetical protein